MSSICGAVSLPNFVKSQYPRWWRFSMVQESNLLPASCNALLTIMAVLVVEALVLQTIKSLLCINASAAAMPISNWLRRWRTCFVDLSRPNATLIVPFLSKENLFMSEDSAYIFFSAKKNPASCLLDMTIAVSLVPSQIEWNSFLEVVAEIGANHRVFSLSQVLLSRVVLLLRYLMFWCFLGRLKTTWFFIFWYTIIVLCFINISSAGTASIPCHWLHDWLRHMILVDGKHIARNPAGFANQKRIQILTVVP